jgi:transposase-like protein
LEALIEADMSIAQIAAAVGRSKATVRHWLIRYGLKTHGGPGRRPTGQAKAAKQAGLATVKMRCIAMERLTSGSADVATIAASYADRPRWCEDAGR